MTIPINERTPRNAMGLADSFVPSVTDQWLIELPKFISSSPNSLRTIMEFSNRSISDRWLAGTALALINDPTIDPLNPKMIIIPKYDNVPIGLPNELIDAITTEFNDLEIQRNWIEKETPRHTRNINSFKISKYLVTNKEYKMFLEQTHFAELPSSWPLGFYPWQKSNHPVYGITPGAADAYCLWLSSITQRKFRLAHEYEWEYAASGKNENLYPWGNFFDKNKVNSIELKLYDSTPVGMFPSGNSEFGVSDMAGNIEEFVANDYEPYPNGPIVNDDLKLNNSNYRIARGGSFTRFRDLTRNKRRHGYFPKEIYVMGFRLAEDL